MKKITLLTLVLVSTLVSMAQQSSIKGIVTDTVDKKNLTNAAVILIRKSDSVLVRFTRTDNAGHFTLKDVPSGKLILQIVYPGFADYVDEISPVPGTETDMAKIDLTPQSKILEEVIVKQNVAIRLKGDTIEYKADSFKVDQGATVKDLLRKLPGLQVDKNGQVTAQGQKVEKILVDGEEFFSDDPAVVIENLRADAVDKVQSFDKKSDQAEFTGVDDGSKSKTLNLVLKDDKKRGLLGKIVVGVGTDQRYNEQAMLNYFKGKKKVSVYGITSNAGITGLGWDDQSKYAGGGDFDDAEITVGSGFIMINNNGDGDFSDNQNAYYDEGIPRTVKAGVHLSNKWDRDKENYNGNYSLKNMNVDAIGNSLTKYILPDSAYYSKENHNSYNRHSEHLFTNTYDFQIDSLASIKVKVNGKVASNDNNTATEAETDDENLKMVNHNKRENTTSTTSQTYLASALYRQKFKKKGRTLSLFLSQKYFNQDGDGYLKSKTDYGNSPLIDSIDQYKTSLTRTLTTTSKLVYTEPAGTKGLVEFNYLFSRIGSNSDRKSFNNENGKYDQLDSLYSIKYGLSYLSNSAGLKYQYTTKKIVANIGANVGISNMAQKDSTGERVRNYHYTNVYPTARVTFKFAPQTSLNISYAGSPTPPTIDQIQPILENTNPLFVTVGNPNLRQAFGHNISVFFTDFKMLTGRSVWLSGSFNPTQNAIVTSQITDAKGATTQQYINTSGNYNYYFWGTYGYKIKKLDTYVNLTLNGNGGQHVNFVDNLRNINNQFSLGPGLSMQRYKENKYSYSFELKFIDNSLQSSISSQKNNFWSQEHNIQGNVYLTKRLVLGSDLNYYFKQRTDVFDHNNSISVWDAQVSYKLFKQKNGTLQFQVNDILKQRKGYDRSFSFNTVSERNYNQLGRFGLLTFTWDFTKNAGQTK